MRVNLKTTHNKKLAALSDEQERPLFSVKNTVIECELDNPLPRYVSDTLALGPKSAILDKFNEKDVLAELDGLLSHCKRYQVNNDIITDINVKTLNYIKKCKKQKSTRNITMTKKYLKDNNLLAIPFDKGIGICVMKKEEYSKKLNTILQLPQFEKVSITRKNGMNPILKEEQRIIELLKGMKSRGEIDDALYKKLKPMGSQPPRLYGLAKVHKNNIPMRPVLSMPGSVYHKIAEQVAEWLETVPECKINSSTKEVCDKISKVKLENDEELVSFDVSSLYTNVPLIESIETCADLLFRDNMKKIPVKKSVFIELAKIASCDVVMSTHDGYYKQIDGLAMGSPPAPHLANGWMSKFDRQIQGNAKLFTRYMDDILRDIKGDEIDNKLAEINNLHPNLTFTIEKENDGKLPFLDMQLMNQAGVLSSTWYSKPTDTGLILNYHSLAPKRYKRSVVSGFVHRIYRACSRWQLFHSSLRKAKAILEHNQYPPTFYEPIIQQTLCNIVTPKVTQEQQATVDNSAPNSEGEADTPKYSIFIQYRGKGTEDYARKLHQCKAPCNIIMTLRKLKTVLPSLKPQVEKELRSGVIYEIKCAVCNAAYVGQTGRHLITRLKEHQMPSAPVSQHMRKCKTAVSVEATTILASTSRSEAYRLTLEALYIEERRPQINTKEEFRSRTLTIKFF